MAVDRGSVATDIGKLLLRVVVGGAIMTHGYPKIFGTSDDGMPRMVRFIDGVAKMGFPYPEYFAWAAALSEFVGGLFLALGLFTRGAAFLIMCTMIVVLYRHRADPWNKKELGLLYLAPAFFTMLSGPGRYSLDALIFRRK
jgi:putative oxidoreductase